AKPYIFSHNIETVKRLTPYIRDRATYEKTLEILSFASKMLKNVKSSIMLGLGETIDEVEATILDLRNSGVNKLVIGQYFPPSKSSYPLKRLYDISDFEYLKTYAINIGIEEVYSHPYARTSYYMVDAIKFNANSTF
ncbi:MAG: lipoyl synthase, partial [bacterium]|nr:lipoyl synthase [bacterium]